MSAPDPFNAWLKDFEGQADAAAEKAAAPKSPEARAASAAFDRWWRAENDSPFEKLSERELALAGDAAQRLERATREKEELQKRVAALESENAVLKDAETRLSAALADAQAAASRTRELLEGKILNLEDRVRSLSEQNKTLDQSRAFLQKGFADAQAESRMRRDEAMTAADRAAAAERQELDLRRKLSDAERELAVAREQRAAQQGALEELRRQSSVYAERLVQAKEQTDTDVLRLHQETKMFVEELRIIANTLRKRGELP